MLHTCVDVDCHTEHDWLSGLAINSSGPPKEMWAWYFASDGFRMGSRSVLVSFQGWTTAQTAQTAGLPQEELSSAPLSGAIREVRANDSTSTTRRGEENDDNDCFRPRLGHLPPPRGQGRILFESFLVWLETAGSSSVARRGTYFRYGFWTEDLD